MKEVLHHHLIPEDQCFGRDVGLEPPGCWDYRVAGTTWLLGLPGCWDYRVAGTTWLLGLPGCWVSTLKTTTTPITSYLIYCPVSRHIMDHVIECDFLFRYVISTF